jgi:hypothetical protein
MQRGSWLRRWVRKFESGSFGEAESICGENGDDFLEFSAKDSRSNARGTVCQIWPA